MDTSGDGGLSGGFALIDRGVVNAFARDIATDLQNAAATMGQRTKTLLHNTAAVKFGDHEKPIALTEAQINTILAGGVISGAPQATIRELREKLKEVAGKKVTIINKNGDPMQFDVGDYARLVAHTKTRQALELSRHSRLQDVGVDLVMVIGSHSPNFCTEFVGEIYSLSGQSAKYPALSSLPSGGPPFHPNCSKSTRPYVEALADG